MKILLAPDSFKNCRSSSEIISVLSDTFKLYNCTIETCPLADGGEGTSKILGESIAATETHVTYHDTYDNQAAGHYFLKHDVAYIDISIANGIEGIPKSDLNPWKASTYGTGQVIANTIEKGARTIYFGLGGSATNDGGGGILDALGFQLLDSQQKPVPRGLNNLDKVQSIQSPKRLKDVQFKILCDVNNPLTGPNGATFTYAPQKGALKADLEMMDQTLEQWGDLLESTSGKEIKTRAGAGAAGGAACGLLAFFDTEIISGSQFIAEQLDLESKVQGADIVITGEGSLDQQSLRGKVISYLITLCKDHSKDLVAVVGRNNLRGNELHDQGISSVISLTELANGNSDLSFDQPDKYLKIAVEKIASDYSLDLRS